MHLFLLLALLLLLQHLLDDLLLLNEESSDDSVTDAATASGTTVGALDGLLGLGELGVLAGSEGGDARQLGAAVTALGNGTALLDVKQTDVTTGSLDDSGSVGGGVVAVAAAVSDTLGDHFCGVVGCCDEDLTIGRGISRFGEILCGWKGGLCPLNQRIRVEKWWMFVT